MIHPLDYFLQSIRTDLFPTSARRSAHPYAGTNVMILRIRSMCSGFSRSSISPITLSLRVGAVDWPFVIDLKNGALSSEELNNGNDLEVPCLASRLRSQSRDHSFRARRKSAITTFSARRLFIKDRAESVAVMAKSPAVLFGE